MPPQSTDDLDGILDAAWRLLAAGAAWAIGKTALGLGTAAMAHLLPDGRLFADGSKGGGLHHEAKAKRVIYLFMSGGPSHLDLWDYKPKLVEEFGKDLPDHVRDGQRITGMTSRQKTLPVAPSKYEFTKHDNNDRGVWVSSLLPHTAKVVKDLCVIHSTFTEAINHDPAVTYIQTGSQVPGRPSLGSWLSYGLGSMNEDLPNYVVMHAKSKHAEQSLFSRLWGTGFMPSDHQGILLRSQGDPVLYLTNPKGVTGKGRRAQLDALSVLNNEHYKSFGDPEVPSRLRQHEMAYRMQTSVPELMDLTKEPESTFELYGKEAREAGTFAACCLNARRLAERGVRNIQIFHRGWDAHGGLPREHENQCKDVDQGCAALIKDLKQRGLLDSTMVVWGSEFGRTPLGENRGGRKMNTGRDHHPFSFSMLMAGGGIKGGQVYGKTDEIGWGIDENPVHPNDLHATMLHLFGINHERLTYRFQGRDFRLTDVAGKVIKDWIA